MSLEFWNQVCKTDPNHAKKVEIGSRKFTAIDAMYQIKNATEHMGIAGKGWGWEVADIQYLPTDQVCLKIRLWKETRENYIEQWGQCGFYLDNKKMKPDNDCMKKATTDGITKCLSYLGFNADVFFGLFDDNKYVEEQRRVHEPYNQLKTMIELNSKTKDMLTNWANSDDAKRERKILRAHSEDKYNQIMDDIKAALEKFDDKV